MVCRGWWLRLWLSVSVQAGFWQLQDAWGLFSDLFQDTLHTKLYLYECCMATSYSTHSIAVNLFETIGPIRTNPTAALSKHRKSAHPTTSKHNRIPTKLSPLRLTSHLIPPLPSSHVTHPITRS